MLIGIHQSHYLPWLRYFEKIAHVDVFIVLDTVQFTKNDWQNRNKIKTAQGVTVLTVPVCAHLGQSLKELPIDQTQPWRKKHWKTIEQAYMKSRYWAGHNDFLAATYAQDWALLNDLNRHMLEYFVAALGIKTRIAYASDMDVPGASNERLINLIKAVGGTRYYSGAFAAQTYLESQAFADAGISIELQHWHAPNYPQLHGPFAPDLSILDLLLNCGPDSLDILRGGRNDTA